MSKTPSNATEVSQAARHMDKEYGASWVDRVNVETLDLNTLDDCVLGQVNKGRPGYLWSDEKNKLYDTYNTPFGVFSCDSLYREHWVAEIVKRQIRREIV